MLNNLIVISDTHIGSQQGLCPPSGARLDGGGIYKPSKEQLWIWKRWEEFWNVWVPKVTRGEPYGIVINGDAIDGIPHNSKEQISYNIADQTALAEKLFKPLVRRSKGEFYIVRGTEAHVGKSGEYEERLAKSLSAKPNEKGQYARYDLWKKVGDKCLVHLLHHIGTTSSNAYEATAVNKELTEEFNEAARWRETPPDIIIRSHRHRHIKISIPTRVGSAIAEVTPGWQDKTAFVWKIAGGRLAPPQFGGIIIRQGDEEFYTRSKVWALSRTRVE